MALEWLKAVDIWMSHMACYSLPMPLYWETQKTISLIWPHLTILYWHGLKNQIVGPVDGLEDNDADFQTWTSEFYIWNPYDKRQNCILWIIIWVLHACYLYVDIQVHECTHMWTQTHTQCSWIQVINVLCRSFLGS